MPRGSKLITNDDSRAGRTPTFLPLGRWSSIARALGLSGRELDVVRCILDGRSEESTARALGISSHTVHTHIDRLHRKLQVGNRAELILRIFAEYVSQVEEGDGHTVGPAPAGTEDAEETC